MHTPGHIAAEFLHWKGVHNVLGLFLAVLQSTVSVLCEQQFSSVMALLSLEHIFPNLQLVDNYTLGMDLFPQAGIEAFLELGGEVGNIDLLISPLLALAAPFPFFNVSTKRQSCLCANCKFPSTTASKPHGRGGVPVSKSQLFCECNKKAQASY